MERLRRMKENADVADEMAGLDPDKWYNIPACIVKAMKHLLSFKEITSSKLAKYEDTQNFFTERLRTIQN